MKRIDPKDVALFFSTHRNVKSRRFKFVDFEGDSSKVTQCCGLMSMVVAARERGDEVARSLDLVQFKSMDCEQGAPIIAPVLGIDAEYAKGFALGWDDPEEDDVRRPWNASEEYNRGFDDGVASYNATMEVTT